MGLFQVSQLLAAREVLYHAAARGARAKTVGFNRWMVAKCLRVAAIANAREMVSPPFVREDTTLRDMVATLRPGELWSAVLGAVPVSEQYGIERARIPEYLGAENYPRSLQILDYEDWNSIYITDSGSQPVDPEDPDSMNPVLHFGVSQNYRLWVPMHRAFYAADNVRIAGESYLENHYPLYLEDMHW